MPIAADLDHVAIALEKRSQAWPRYVRDLGGVWAGEGPGPGFLFSQVEFANEMKVEVLEPHDVSVNDFLRRFIDRSGPGIHHITFKVTDFDAAIDASTAAGFPPVGVTRDDPDWMEAFLHPKAASGIVVQLAKAGSEEGWDEQVAPSDLPAPARRRATLDRIVHYVADLDAARSVFEGLLGGRPVDEGTDVTGAHVELAWPGPGRIRFFQPSLGTADSQWLGSRTGRAHHLVFTAADPGSIPDTVARRDNDYEIDPDANFGVRLILRPPLTA
jgi:catechol 2,3-dioxygenase-like lactoylglutathione lyase family enzyme